MIKVSKHPNTPAMRIQYLLSVLLSVFVMVSACQRGAERMYMDSNGSPATRQAKEESRASLIPSQALISGLSDTNAQNGKGSLLPSTSSNGALASTAQSVHVLQPHSDKNASGEVAKSQDAKREEVSQASSGLTDWFHRFVDAVDHAEEWAEVAGLLAEGRRCGYLDKGVAWDDDEYTPLHYAAEEGDLEIVKELIEKHNVPVDIRTGEGKRTPLHLAALQGHLKVVKFLIERFNAKWDQEDKDGSNALHYAASGTEGDANVEIVKYLIEEKYANPSAKVAGFNVLYLAIKVNNPELVRYFVTQYPVLTSAVCKEEVPPLEFARATGKRTIADIIEKAVKNVSPF